MDFLERTEVSSTFQGDGEATSPSPIGNQAAFQVPLFSSLLVYGEILSVPPALHQPMSLMLLCTSSLFPRASLLELVWLLFFVKVLRDSDSTADNSAITSGSMGIRNHSILLGPCFACVRQRRVLEGQFHFPQSQLGPASSSCSPRAQLFVSLACWGAGPQCHRFSSFFAANAQKGPVERGLEEPGTSCGAQASVSKKE